jgi:Flp pilus assembly CpaE family ATPase
VQVVATAADDRQLAEALRQLEPDGVVASPALLRGSGASRAGAVLAVDTRESIGGLRTAVGVGARGFFVWPAERDDLATASARLRAVVEDRATNGRIVGVHSARGGAGVTFVASHLASALSRRAGEVILLDLDVPFGGLAPALDVPPDTSVRTVSDLAAVARDVAPSELVRGLWRHPEGFAAVPVGRDAAHGTAFSADELVAVMQGVAGACDVVVADIGRGFGAGAGMLLADADVVVMLLTLDVASFRATKHAVDQLGIDERCVFVVNRSRRSDVSPADVERVFGRPPTAVIPFDAGVATAQDRGRLLGRRGRVGRAIERLAGRVMERS